MTWSNNNFNTSVSGDAANNAKIYDPGLMKTSGWRTLNSGQVDGSEFCLTDKSKNIGNGTSINGYNDRIYFSDYEADDVVVKLKSANPPDIGAWTAVVDNMILPPDGFRLQAAK